MTHTRFPSLAYMRAGRCWRLVDITDYKLGDCPSFVGPMYRTRAELLADLQAYAERAGWLS